MNSVDLKLLLLNTVISTTITALLVILIDIFNEKEKHRKIKYKLLLYFISHILTDICYLVYFYNPPLFIWFNWLLMLNIILVPFFLYSFIFNITKTNPEEKLSYYHYIIPIALSLAMMILSFLTPYEEQIKTIKGHGTYFGESVIFTIFSNKLPIRLIFNLLYVYLTFKRLSPYRKYISNFSANESKTSLRWVNILILFIISLTLIPIFGIFMSRIELATSYISYIQSSLLIFQHCFLVYHVIKGNYILEEPIIKSNEKIVSITETIKTQDQEVNVSKYTLTAAKVNKYMNVKKPFLDPNLKINELAEMLGVNRTYMSSFINSEYGINFSNYINSLRLKEYYRLRSIEEYKDFSNSELTEKAGFGSYRSFNRIASQFTMSEVSGS